MNPLFCNTGISGPDLEFLYADVNAPGRWHDSNVLQRSTLFLEWDHLDPRRRMCPFPSAVLLGNGTDTYNVILSLLEDMAENR